MKRIKKYLLEKNHTREVLKLDRQVETMNFEKANTIGILYDASEESEHHKVSSFVRHLQAMGKTVKAVGYVPFKIIPHYCHPKLAFNFITLNDINWYGKPHGKYVDDFLESSFDMLIDLSIKPNESVLYIASLTNARFKIGLYSETNKNVFDFMLTYEESTDLSGFIKQLMHYIEMIKTN